MSNKEGEQSHQGKGQQAGQALGQGDKPGPVADITNSKPQAPRSAAIIPEVAELAPYKSSEYMEGKILRSAISLRMTPYSRGSSLFDQREGRCLDEHAIASSLM